MWPMRHRSTGPTHGRRRRRRRWCCLPRLPPAAVAHPPPCSTTLAGVGSGKQLPRAAVQLRARHPGEAGAVPGGPPGGRAQDGGGCGKERWAGQSDVSTAQIAHSVAHAASKHVPPPQPAGGAAEAGDGGCTGGAGGWSPVCVPVRAQAPGCWLVWLMCLPRSWFVYRPPPHLASSSGLLPQER